VLFLSDFHEKNDQGKKKRDTPTPPPPPHTPVSISQRGRHQDLLADAAGSYALLLAEGET
jgi:hypothetical protein